MLTVTLDSFKKHARRLELEIGALPADARNLSHAESLEMLSRIFKFSNYHEAQKRLNNEASVKPEVSKTQDELCSFFYGLEQDELEGVLYFMITSRAGHGDNLIWAQRSAHMGILAFKLAQAKLVWLRSMREQAIESERKAGLSDRAVLPDEISMTVTVDDLMHAMRWEFITGDIISSITSSNDDLKRRLDDYLESLPGFGNPTTQEAKKQHGYLQMQWTDVLSSSLKKLEDKDPVIADEVSLSFFAGKEPDFVSRKNSDMAWWNSPVFFLLANRAHKRNIREIRISDIPVLSFMDIALTDNEKTQAMQLFFNLLNQLSRIEKTADEISESIKAIKQ